MIYVILGMHKSGTTMVSQMLHHAGINMVDVYETGISYDQGNKYERQSVKKLNEDILNCRGQESIDIAAPSTIQLTDIQRAQMRTVVAQCNEKYQLWGFKDPRTCLLYPLWASELPPHKIIAVYRSPQELWQRYRSDHQRNRYRDPIKAWKFLNRWYEHNTRILKALQTTPMNFIVLEYRPLVSTQSEFERLQFFVGQPLSDRRQIELYRHQLQKKSLLLKMIDQTIAQRYGYRSDEIIKQLEALQAVNHQDQNRTNNSTFYPVGTS